MRVLDLGAGNGIVAETLSGSGVQSIVGVDIIEEAERAARRDRPEVYEDYLVGDIRDPSLLTELSGRDFNCLICVAALGFGDISASVFGQAYNLVAPGGWIAFNVKHDFLEEEKSDMARLVDELGGTVDIRARERYRHRYAVNGQPLYYEAIVGKKLKDLSPKLLAS